MRALWLGTVLLVLFGFAGCGGDEEVPADETSSDTSPMGGLCSGVIGDGAENDSVQCRYGTGGSVDFGGVRGRFDLMPPLPSGFVAVSDYIEFDVDEGPPPVAGIALPLTQPIDDVPALGFYTYRDGDWERVADVISIRDGKAEGGFTSFPANLVVLKQVP